jgi:hypothetical protein
MVGNNYLPTEYQTFIHASRYARWLPDDGRRETWIETVSRFSNFMQGHLDKNLGVVLDSEVWRRIEDSIIGLSSNAFYERINDCRFCIRKREYCRLQLFLHSY